jgi:hypothetical protein
MILFIVLIRCARGNPRNLSHPSDSPFQESAQDVEDQLLLPSADDLPLHERDPRGLADAQVALDLLPFQGLLLLRPLQPRHRLLYSSLVFIYTHFVYKAIRDNEIVRAYRAELNLAMFINCYIVYIEFANLLKIQ